MGSQAPPKGNPRVRSCKIIDVIAIKLGCIRSRATNCERPAMEVRQQQQRKLSFSIDRILHRPICNTPFLGQQVNSTCGRYSLPAAPRVSPVYAYSFLATSPLMTNLLQQRVPMLTPSEKYWKPHSYEALISYGKSATPKPLEDKDATILQQLESTGENCKLSFIMMIKTNRQFSAVIILKLLRTVLCNRL